MKESGSMFYVPPASEWARWSDWLQWYISGWNFFFTALVFLGVFVFAIKYRRRTLGEVPRPVLGSMALEITWSVIPLLIALTMFTGGAALYYNYATPPASAMEVYVIGKQWMWHLQHPEGQREINELHVPLGRSVKLTMSSEDVIHSFFVPAFRLKRDVIPGRYTSIWFTAERPGKYHLFCAEYCGTNHSGMIGWVYVMEPADYEAWLAGGGAGSMAQQGEKLFSQFGCASCHLTAAQGRCPTLTGVFGQPVLLRGGQRVLADEAYVRESILTPSAKIVDGFQNIMPSFQGQISEQNILQLIAYVKSLGVGNAAPGVTAPAKTPARATAPAAGPGSASEPGSPQPPARRSP
jgi:cytochrome c oxidase subunit 2